MGRFIYIAGADGTGKSTQARLLVQHLQDRGVHVRHLWLRFPFFLSLPLLVYARWRGYSWHEVTGEIDHGYWDFRHSWIMRQIFPWVLLVDAAVASLLKVYLPLWFGYTVVCERYVLDMLVDLSLAIGSPVYKKGQPGKSFLRLLPADCFVFVLSLDAKTVRERRSDLLLDRQLEKKLQFYEDLAESLSFVSLDARLSPTCLAESINSRILSTEE